MRTSKERRSRAANGIGGSLADGPRKDTTIISAVLITMPRTARLASHADGLPFASATPENSSGQ